MNYRHAFHAGNHADVLKHAVYAAALSRLGAKAKPMVVLDVFAGGGRYDLLLDERAERTGEWRGGIGALWASRPRAPAALAAYLGAVAAANADDRIRFYPGSPALALALMRSEDKALFVDAHPDERAALEDAIGSDRRARVYAGDGWEAIRSFLPPTPRRGALLVDPPFEAPGDADRLVDAAGALKSRWATGVGLFWRAITARSDTARYRAGMAAALGEIPLLIATFTLGASAFGLDQPGGAGRSGLLGSDIAVANPPYGLEDDIAAFGPWLGETLGGVVVREWLTPRR